MVRISALDDITPLLRTPQAPPAQIGAGSFGLSLLSGPGAAAGADESEDLEKRHLDRSKAEISLMQQLHRRSEWPTDVLKDGETPDLLKQYFKMRNALPILYRAARKYLSAAHNAGADERVFSKTGATDSDLRHSMEPERVGMHAFVRHNIKYYPVDVDVIAQRFLNRFKGGEEEL